MTDFPHGGDVRGLAMRLGCKPSDITDFSASINPLGPPDWLRTAIASVVSELVHYPDPECREFLAAAAQRYGVPQEELVAGNGTSDLLFAVARAARKEGYERAVIPVPAYCDYRTACERAGLTVKAVPQREEDTFALDAKALGEMLSSEAARLSGKAVAMLARPGNPTGLDVGAEAVRGLAREHPGCLFVVDEAFGSFVQGFESLLGERPDNVVVLASLTKMFAVPGLRLGLAAACAGFARSVRLELSPWSVNGLAQAVGARAMADRDFEANTRTAVAALREGLARELSALPGVTVWPGRANYLLCRLEGMDAASLREALLAKRIAIRDCSNMEGLDGRFFRVAVRSAEDNEKLVEAASAVLNPRLVRAPRCRKTPALMIQGCSSNAGKTVIAAALCRILREDGVRVAPFKAQNMSLNSCVTAWGEEIGRAQVLQAMACGLAPQARMNPVLLKPSSETGSQVIVMGRPVGNMRVHEYIAYKPKAFQAVRKAYDSLAAEFDAVILEGAGSPAEVNLKPHDLVNMAMAAYARAKVLLVGDIDRGGVFAALAGTMELFSEAERRRVGGFILNRFRGDATLLDPALAFMKDLTGKPVLGVVPNIANLGLPEEDSVSFKAGGFTQSGDCELDIAVLDLPHISNFTDFDALAREPDAGLRLVRGADDLGRPDAVIVPGSKNTLADLAHLRASGLARSIVALVEAGCEVVGICAGLQMLGEAVSDPLGMESGLGVREGLGLLPLRTGLAAEKTLLRSTARHLPSGLSLKGYQIHHGVTVASAGKPGPPVLAVREDPGRGETGEPLAWGLAGRAWGTYLHGVFDADGFRRWWLDGLRIKKGLPPLDNEAHPEGSFDRALEESLDRLAAVVREFLDMDAVYALLGL